MGSDVTTANARRPKARLGQGAGLDDLRIFVSGARYGKPGRFDELDVCGDNCAREVTDARIAKQLNFDARLCADPGAECLCSRFRLCAPDTRRTGCALAFAIEIKRSPHYDKIYLGYALSET